MRAQSLGRVQLLVTPWTAAHQAPLVGETRVTRDSFPPPGDLPDSGIKPKSLAFPAMAGGFFTTKPPGKPYA